MSGLSSRRSAITLRGLTVGAGAGALGMYLFDPHRGAARRGRILDKSRSFVRGLEFDAIARVRDLEHRLRGFFHEVRGRLAGEQVTDEILVQRVRAQLGRPVSHSRAIEVRADNGKVYLVGPIFEDEIDRLLTLIRRIRGVREVHDSFDIYLRADPGRKEQHGRLH